VTSWSHKECFGELSFTPVLRGPQMVFSAHPAPQSLIVCIIQVIQNDKALFLNFGYNPKTEMKLVGPDLFNAGFLIRFSAQRQERSHRLGCECGTSSGPEFRA
jgi:hypothetical protein